MPIWGDVGQPKCRSRHVAKEFKRGAVKMAENFAAMPPLSSKWLLTIATTRRMPDFRGEMRLVDKVYCISFIDISRPHIVRPATGELYVELPTEAQTPGEDLLFGFMFQSMYGTRDAGANWDHATQDVMVIKLNFTQGSGNSCNYWHQARDLKSTVHGDDFATLGEHGQLKRFASEIQKHWEDRGSGNHWPPLQVPSRRFAI